MNYKITYISYSVDDQDLRSRSVSILDDFFKDKNYKIQNEYGGILFVASGGSEQIVKEIVNEEPNIILLCHRESNSYAATMEIASYFRSEGKRVSVIDVMMTGAFEEFEKVQNVYHAVELLSGQKAAVIGEISDWLINSDIDNELVRERLGVQLLRLPWSELGDYNSCEPSKELINFFPDIAEKNLVETARVYELLDRIITQYDLSAISVECFSMVRNDKVTACLPLAVINTKNTVAACEGDVCSMIGSMLIKAVSGIIPWQANVAEIKHDSILFAHCTAPLMHLTSFNITTHYESNCGTAIQGKFIKGEYGVFRINNSLDKYMLLEGQIIETPSHSFACRTQIEFRTSNEQTALLKNNGLGNHHLIFPAEYISVVEKMMEVLQVERVVGIKQ